MQTKPSREAELHALVQSLTKLVEILRKDNECNWLHGFEGALMRAKELDPMDQDSLSSLSASIMSVYGGMGSFGDYMPTNWENPKEMKEFDLCSGAVYDNALKLRVIGRY
jgi:hypothetical protein